MIDNYDSFTYNLVQYFMQLGQEIRVFRNDEITVAQAEEIPFDYLVISPGPGGPRDAGCSMEMIRAFAGRKPILGVCLGHQSIGEVFGGTIVRAAKIMHGKSDCVTHDGKTLFAGLPNPLRVIRYHSLAIARNTVPAEFEVSATSQDGEIMAVRHKRLPVEGVQFHPESIGTEEGMKILSNFINGNASREPAPVKELLGRLVTGKDLTGAEAGGIMEQITQGTVTQSQIGSLLTALTIKGVTVAELTGFARVLVDKAVKVPVAETMRLTDTCGTGGDGCGTFNISTACALVACGAGVRVAKHGNRSITSKCGSADVFEALGVKIDMTPAQSAQSLSETGICFLFAPGYHPAFKNIMGPRRELGFRTVFNMIGPLLNPARVTSQVMGVFSADITEMIAETLGNLGVVSALVVHGSDGTDEITLTGTTRVTQLKDRWIRTWDLDPREFGFSYCKPDDLKGGSPGDNAAFIRGILDGEKGPRRDIVLLNSAAAVLAAGLAADFGDALGKARQSVDSGAARDVLEKFVAFSKTV
jgi:anthranilate synthase/phosphoribosyltransferase